MSEVDVKLADRTWAMLAADEAKLLAPLGEQDGKRWLLGEDEELFGRSVRQEVIARAFAIMAATPRHTYLLATARPRRLLDLTKSLDFWHLVARAVAELPVDDDTRSHASDVLWRLPNLWPGVRVGTQLAAETRIRYLAETEAVGRWVLCDLRGPVDLTCWLGTEHACHGDLSVSGGGPVQHTFECCEPSCVDWVVVAEGPGAGSELAWMQSIRDQSVVAGVPCFFAPADGASASRQQTEISDNGEADGWPRELPRELSLRST